MTMERDVEFLYEMGSLRYIPRMWKRYSNNDFANLAEHHVRVAWIAMMIAAHEKDVDTGKILKMALVHDIAESRTGDVDDLARQYVKRNEELGIRDILQDTALADEFVALWQEAEAKETLEAKIVKDADNLDVDLELRERATVGSHLGERLNPQRKIVAETKLYTKTAKHFWNAIQESDPHDWHRNGRTRLNAGDWKVSQTETDK
jgi:putative hydrolase of HD superfamily